MSIPNNRFLAKQRACEGFPGQSQLGHSSTNRRENNACSGTNQESVNVRCPTASEIGSTGIPICISLDTRCISFYTVL